MSASKAVSRQPTSLWSLLWIAVSLTCVVAKRPNILFIITDDQDNHMDSIEHMPLLQKYVTDEGTAYENHFCTIAICCPSRVNLWTGRAAHNTNVTDVSPPYGGYPKIVREGINDDYLPIWMQAAGYNTYYTGKLWNSHNVYNYDKPYVRGYNGSDFLLDPYTYDYWHAKMTRNGAAPEDYSGQYSPDVISDKASGFLDEALQHEEPFFLTVAPIAPHSNINAALHSSSIAGPAPGFSIPEYAPRHAHLFQDYKIPRGENFNPEQQSGASWVSRLPRLNDTVIAYNDEFQRARLRSLQSVDEMIERLIKQLDDRGALDNTYVFFTTDNGFSVSQHRRHPGKECGYETDIHIPLIVRGPGIAAGKSSDLVSSHSDIAPTLLGIAGHTRADFDGLAIPLGDESAANGRGEHVNVEFWGVGLPEGIYGVDEKADPAKYGGNFYPNNTYKSLRLIGQNYSLYYSVWCTGEREFYDLKRDPGQMHNYFGNSSLTSECEIAGRPFAAIIYRLDALLVILKECRGKTCTHPWESHHPEGVVRTLEDSLNKRWDGYYAAQPKVGFSSCELGYIREAEGNHRYIPELANQKYDEDEYQQTFRYNGRWSDWT